MIVRRARVGRRGSCKLRSWATDKRDKQTDAMMCITVLYCELNGICKRLRAQRAGASLRERPPSEGLCDSRPAVIFAVPVPSPFQSPSFQKNLSPQAHAPMPMTGTSTSVCPSFTRGMSAGDGEIETEGRDGDALADVAMRTLRALRFAAGS